MPVGPYLCSYTSVFLQRNEPPRWSGRAARFAPLSSACLRRVSARPVRRSCYPRRPKAFPSLAGFDLRPAQLRSFIAKSEPGDWPDAPIDVPTHREFPQAPLQQRSRCSARRRDVLIFRPAALPQWRVRHRDFDAQRDNLIVASALTISIKISPCQSIGGPGRIVFASASHFRCSSNSPRMDERRILSWVAKRNSATALELWPPGVPLHLTRAATAGNSFAGSASEPYRPNPVSISSSTGSMVPARLARMTTSHIGSNFFQPPVHRRHGAAYRPAFPCETRP